MAWSILKDISAEQFLAEYWQQKPLLIRNALTDFKCPIDPDELAGLACEAEVESRLIEQTLGDQNQPTWQLSHGPFDEDELTRLATTNWTLLVQAVDLWVPEFKELLNRFSFLPPWRLDDIMVSYAAPGGSVGPHFDYYDVFLVQVHGQRQWQVGEKCSAQTPLRTDTPLRILADFHANQEWTLEPGDILYLPPTVAHWGSAIDACMTCSVGFRAPTLSEMLGDLAACISEAGDTHYLTDPPLTLDMASTDIDGGFIDQARALLQQVLDDKQLLADWYARYMTSPKYPDLVDLTGEQRIAEIHGIRYENGQRQ